jgi:hypothetical protein
VQLIKKHSLTLVLYVIYLVIWLNDLRIEYKLNALEKTLAPGERLPPHEWWDLTFLTGIPFCFFMAANALGRSSDQTRFYLLMLVLIIIPLFILGKY